MFLRGCQAPLVCAQPGETSGLLVYVVVPLFLVLMTPSSILHHRLDALSFIHAANVYVLFTEKVPMVQPIWQGLL